MRLVFAASVGGTGAIEKHVLRVAEAARTGGYDVTLLAPHVDGGLLERAAAVGVRGVHVPFASAFDLRSRAHVARTLNRLQPDLVHAHDPRSLLAVTPLVGPRRRLVFTDHNSSEGKTESGFYARERGWRPIQPGLRRLLRRIDLAILPSQSTLRDLQDRLELRRPSEVVYHGIDVSVAGMPTRGRVVLLSRHSPEKGVDVAVRAAALIPEAHFVVAGDGPERSSVERLAADLGVADRVMFVGMLEDPSALRDSATCVCLPSRWDNAPHAVIESLAAGRPVVASRVGGVPELVEDGRTGLLVKPEDPPALAAAIRRVIVEEGLASRLGEAARREARVRFSVARMWRDHERLYEAVCA